MLTLAVPKGRIKDDLLTLLGDRGPSTGDLASRRLILDGQDLRFILLKDADVATYVAHGVADLGVVGSDHLEEAPADVLMPLDLGIGRCAMCLAGVPSMDLAALQARRQVTVASRYPRIAARSLAARGLVARVVPLSGSVEAAVVTGLADAIVDLVQTGRTLEENGLVVHAELMAVSARVVVNRAAFRLRHTALRDLLDTLRERALEAGHAAG